ncbi:MAG TPA: DUF5009 domain-containing protein [Opitutaceae bacterium]|jgi:predicted acyltransferase|nr:DUF5009 domain-containing protein [Opitutaceae bacterium]
MAGTTLQPPASPDPAVEVPTRPPRLMSVDVLRGFDMFWIIGGEHLVKALNRIDGGPVLAAVATQLSHTKWEGFTFFDLIFPLFLFLIGVSIVFSMDRMLATAGRRAAFIRIVRRSILLFALGVIYYGGISKGWANMQWAGVLHRIALCYLFGAILYVMLPRRGIVVASLVCLIGYWSLMTFVPVPDLRLDKATIGQLAARIGTDSPAALSAAVPSAVRGSYEEGLNLAHYVDFRFLPGHKRNTYYTNEGLLSTIPSIATTLFGIMAGWVLKDTRRNDRNKVILLIVAGAAAIVAGMLWGISFPIVKRLWTSSYCLVASGASAALLGVFYMIIDVWKWQRWTAPFLWIGTNALVVYLAVNFIDFEALSMRFVGGEIRNFLDTTVAPGTGGLLVASVALMIPLLLLRFLYRNRIFIRL